MLDRRQTLSRLWSTARWGCPCQALGTLGVLAALGVTVLGHGAIAEQLPVDLLSTDSLTTGPGRASFRVTLAEGLDWSNHSTSLNGVDISDLVATAEGKVVLNVVEHPLRYGTNRLRTRAVSPQSDGRSRHVDIDLLAFNVEAPEFSTAPVSPLRPVDSRIVPDDPSDLSNYQVRVGHVRTDEGDPAPADVYTPPIDVSTCPNGSWLWFVVLQRDNQLKLTLNKVYSSCQQVIGQEIFDTLEDEDPHHPTSQNYTVIVNHLALPNVCQQVTWPRNQVTRLNAVLHTLTPIFDAPCSFSPWSAIIVPSPKGMAFEHSSPKTGDTPGPAAANLSGGFLETPSGKLYDFVQTDVVVYDTRASEPRLDMPAKSPLCHKTAHNTIYVNGTCYQAPALEAGSTGGFQMLVLDRESLAPISNTTYSTGSEHWDQSAPRISAMKGALDGVREDQLVFVVSLHEPFGFVQAQADDHTPFNQLAFSMERIGGTPEAIICLLEQLACGTEDVPATYSLVGTKIERVATLPQSSTAIVPELHVNVGQGPETIANPGRLRGVLARGNRNRWYAPLTHEIVGVGDFDFAQIVGQRTAHWPVPDPNSGDERGAYDWITKSLVVLEDDQETFPFAPDPRLYYYSKNIKNLQNWQSHLNGLKFPDDAGFSSAAFDKVRAQLEAEVAKVIVIRSADGFAPTMVDVMTAATIDAVWRAGGVIAEFEDDVKVPDDTPVVGFISGILKVFGAIGAAAEMPAASGVANVLSAVFSSAGDLVRPESGGSFTFQETVESVRNATTNLANQFQAVRGRFDLQIRTSVGDWGQLSALAEVWESGDWNDLDSLQAENIISLGYQRSIAEALTKQLYARLQRGNFLGVDDFYEWGSDPAFGNRFRFSFAPDWADHITYTTHAYALDGRLPLVDVILIKTEPVLDYQNDRGSVFTKRPFADILTNLLTADVTFQSDNGTETSSGGLGLYKPDIFRRWDLTTLRCDWVRPEDLRTVFPIDCWKQCHEGTVDAADCDRLPGSPVR